jgi:hypothetical protein
MFNKVQNTKYLYDNIKNGDFIGFYTRPWYYIFSKIISLVTGGKLSHVAGVFDVVRSKNILSFRLGEQSLTYGKIITEYVMIDMGEKGITLDSRFRHPYSDFYLLPNGNLLDEFQNEQLANYWQEKEDYSVKELAFTVNWFYKLFGDRGKVYDNNCSTACRESMMRIGVYNANEVDKVPNPTEFSKFSYIDNIIKLDFSK